MSARSGFAGKNTSWPYLGPSRGIFCMGQKNLKNVKILPIFPWWANGPYSPAFGYAPFAQKKHRKHDVSTSCFSPEESPSNVSSSAAP